MGVREIEVRLLGAFEVRIDGSPVAPDAFAGRRALELVQLLALADGHRLVGDEVIDALWPHLDASAGRANLRKAAHHARRALGRPDAITLRGGLVHLCPTDHVRTDVAVFRAAYDAARRTGRPEAAAHAASRYAGPLLPSAPYEEWTLAPRDELRTKYRQMLEAGARWADVLALEPAHEGAHQALMRAALDAGRRAEAIDRYERLRTALWELGVAPSAASQQLYAACVDGIGASPPHVGRHDELGRATAAARRAGDGRGGCIVVHGAPGVGRTAFATALGELLGATGWRVLPPVVATRDGAYGTVVRLVDAVHAAHPHARDALDEHRRAVLGALTPARRPAGALHGPNSRHQVIGALHALLVAAGGPDPLLVTIDDAHLADDASAEVLAYVVATGAPIVVVLNRLTGLARPVLDEGLVRLERAAQVTTIGLGPLDPDAAATLARHGSERPLTVGEVAQVLDLAEGRPGLVLELARATGEAPADRAPARAVELVGARLAALDAPTRATLARLALADEELDAATAVALANDTEDTVFAVLDRALMAGVLRVVDGRYRFGNDLVQAALVAEVLPHRRAAVHADAAHRLEELAAPAAAIARQWSAAGRHADAAPWLLVAAREALATSAFADARRGADEVLAHDPRHSEALQIRARALDAAGDVGTLAAYDAAITTADAGDVDDLRAMRALAQIKTGDAAGALLAVAGVQPRTVEGRLCEALTYSGAAALGFADPSIGTTKAAAARRLALETGDEASIVIASWAQAAAAHARGELRDSVLADLRDTKDLPHLAVRVFDGHLCFTQRFLYGSRPYDDVIAFADGLAAEAQRLGAARGHAFGVQLRGEAELLSGRLDDAEAHLLDGGRLHRALGGAVGESHALQRLAELAMLRGRHASAANLLDQSLDVARATDIGFHLLDRIYGTRMTLASTLDPAGGLVAVEEAEAAVRGPLETCPGCRIMFAVPAGIAAARGGDIDRARGYEQLSTYLADVVMRLPAWDAALAELRGHVAQAGGDVASATVHFTAAAAGFARAGQPADVARTRALAAGGH